MWLLSTNVRTWNCPWDRPTSVTIHSTNSFMSLSYNYSERVTAESLFVVCRHVWLVCVQLILVRRGGAHAIQCRNTNSDHWNVRMAWISQRMAAKFSSAIVQIHCFLDILHETTLTHTTPSSCRATKRGRQSDTLGQSWRASQSVVFESL